MNTDTTVRAAQGTPHIGWKIGRVVLACCPASAHAAIGVDEVQTLIVLVPALVAAAVYFRLAVFRLSRPRGWALTALVVVAIGALQLAGLASWSVAAVLVSALLFGHLGDWLGQARKPGTDARVQGNAAPASGLSPPAAPDPADLPALAGNMLGRYVLDRQIGRGSMGAVYLGRDPKIGRPVAIKTLALSQLFAGDELAEARTRFFREAEMAGRLQHPDIVTIFDAGEDRALAYIAMEFLGGHDLQRHTQRDRLLPVPQVLDIAARLAQALAHAHRQGVVHRDIKPANVMLDPHTGSVKLTDFGIARITDSSRSRTGMVLGTPSYMAPEQMAGDLVDGRADLYSLGVVLFQLLTGRLPHEAPSLAVLMRQIANDAAPDVRSLRPELPEALANVVALALEKRVALRYADGHQLAGDLHAVAAMLPVVVTPRPPESGGPQPR